ncbi:MAG TPA: hypothetical protein VEB67_01420 [Nitrososphaerales archaeon]|nr:hypothetical protein [Nitrososphaerales archaeon]
MRFEKKSESKVLQRSYIEATMEGKSGRMSRKEAVDALASDMGVPAENVALISLKGESGTEVLKGRFHVYDNFDAKKRLHPRYQDERALTKEERDKLRQERKKAKTPAPPAEGSK